MTDLTELQNQFEALSKYDQEIFLSSVEEKKARGKRTRSDFSEEELLVFDVICELSTLDQKPISLRRLVEMYGPVKYAERVAAIFSYLSDARSKLNDQKQFRELLKITLDCLTRDIRYPSTAQALLDNVTQLRSSVDRRYPGYAEAGFLHRIV